MKRILNKLIKDEAGLTFILVLILLLVGGLILAPLLGFMGSGLIAGQAYEKNVAELYAADAGVELAIWELQFNQLIVEPEDQTTLPTFNTNDKNVVATIEGLLVGEEEPLTFLITSTATSVDGSSTTIESYVTASGGFFSLFDNAITSPGDVTIKNGVTVEGDVQYNGTLDNNGIINGDISEEPIIWPTTEELSRFFQADVAGAPHVPPGHTINITGSTELDPYSLGPLYAEGDLTVTGSGVVRLDGTIYVAGSLVFNPTPSQTVYLNLQSIFAEGDITFQPGCLNSGSGCIIAVGDIDYQPQISGDEFVFLLSLEGTTFLKPGDSFYGSIAGDCDVNLWPGATLEYVSPTDGLNLPGVGSGSGNYGTKLVIDIWEIDPS